MLSPGGIDTPFSHGKWNPDSKKRSPEELEEDTLKKKKKKRNPEHDLGDAEEVIGNLSHLLSNMNK